MMGLEVGAVGSPADVATLVVVIVGGLRFKQMWHTAAAGIVALAENHRNVDHERLQSDLGVDERDLDAVRPTIADGNGGEKAT